MDVFNLLQYLATTLERLRLQYLVTGSMATSLYGDPRLTNDIDVVVELPRSQIDAFCTAFPDPDYYCPREMVEDSVRHRYPFNVLQPSTGIKIDVIIATDSPFDRSRLSRGVRVLTGNGIEAWFASPEDVILKKLDFYREGRSDKHVRDILGVLKVRGPRMDRAYIAAWAARLGVTAEWELVLAQMPPANP